MSTQHLWGLQYPPQQGIDAPDFLHVLLDYTGRGDTQPIYLGKAVAGTSAGDEGWVVTKYRYESSAADARLVEWETQSGIVWANRVNAPWSF